MSKYKDITLEGVGYIQADEWKEIEFAPSYEVSNLGNVRSIDRMDSKGRLKKGKLLNPLNVTNGYKAVNLHYFRDGIPYRRTWTIHKLVSLCFLSQPPGKIYVNHIDSNKANNNVNNLEWCTPSENNIHATKNFRASRQYPKEVYQKVVDLKRSGVGVTQISRNLGIPFISVQQILKKNEKYHKL